jgi:hypothetical protein
MIKIVTFEVDSAVNHLPPPPKKKKKKMRKQTKIKTSSKCISSSSDYIDTLLNEMTKTTYSKCSSNNYMDTLSDAAASSPRSTSVEKKKKLKKKNNEKIVVEGMTSTKEYQAYNDSTVNTDSTLTQIPYNNNEDVNLEWQQQVNEANKTDTSSGNKYTNSNIKGTFKRMWKLLTSKTKKKKNKRKFLEEEEIVFVFDISTIICKQQLRSRPPLIRTLTDHSSNTIPLNDIDSKVLNRISPRDLVHSIRSAQSKRKLSDENKEMEICFLKESARQFDNKIDSKDQKKRSSRTTISPSTLKISSSRSRTPTPPRRRNTHTVSPRKPIRRSRRRRRDGGKWYCPTKNSCFINAQRL